ncbi:AraC family transcriptional regulator [Pelagicoccus sp. SDUM812003]|uniref:helix-turn-helix transcriptional regulator n=1 Tax=Pelagicoccus sp. SDUM812003 TaxID=3041267 RepID=UPI00280CA797|nr:AraC family transcriptional regulator [Pelagicoccus sp. SDUM812003]MDQ8202597.1 AraC family transcriptional regulator [Pelagicoccus sp. SDUM812003]
MKPQSSAEAQRKTTYCPFKAPSRPMVAFGDALAAVDRFEQRPGMSLLRTTLPDGASNASSLWPVAEHLQILYLAEGILGLSIDGRNHQRIESGSWVLLKPAGCRTSFTRAGNCRLIWIECDLQATESLTGFSHTVSPQLLDKDRPFMASEPASGRLLALGQELSSIDGSTTRSRLLIESKTLEWLAMLLDQPIFSPCAAVSNAKMAREESSLNTVARILETRYHEDHSIAQLSRASHLNEFKLKRGFKERFGTTVFGYLRQVRMERARDILQAGSSSVIEVANAVGYSNPSHFARAFKEAYGINPSVLLRQESILRQKAQ